MNTLLMQCFKIDSLCVFGSKLGKGWANLAFLPIFKHLIHKLHILKLCTNNLELNEKCDRKLYEICNLDFYETVKIYNLYAILVSES